LPAVTVTLPAAWPRTLTVTVWAAPLFSAGPSKALFVPVTVTVPV
jgi:hypothetical protein